MFSGSFLYVNDVQVDARLDTHTQKWVVSRFCILRRGGVEKRVLVVGSAGALEAAMHAFWDDYRSKTADGWAERDD